MTVRRAIGVLLDRGAVSTTRGRGTFVKPLQLNAATFELGEFHDLLDDPRVEARVLEARVLPAGARAAANLAVSEGTAVISIRRLLQRGDEPLFYHRESLVYDPSTPTVEAELGVTALRDLFEGGVGAGPKRGELVIHRRCSPRRRPATSTRPAGSAALVLEHLFYGYDDKPMSWGRFVCRGDLLQFRAHIGVQATTARAQDRDWRAAPDATGGPETLRMKPRSGLDPASLTCRIAALDEQGSLDAVRERVGRGDDPLGIIDDCQRGMQYVGEDYQSGEYFISGLIMAGEIFREAMEILEPLLPASAAGGAGRRRASDRRQRPRLHRARRHPRHRQEHPRDAAAIARLHRARPRGRRAAGRGRPPGPRAAARRGGAFGPAHGRSREHEGDGGRAAARRAAARPPPGDHHRRRRRRRAGARLVGRRPWAPDAVSGVGLIRAHAKR